MERNLQQEYVIALHKWKDISLKLSVVLEDYIEVIDKIDAEYYEIFEDAISEYEEDRDFAKNITKFIKFANRLIDNPTTLAKYKFLQKICTSYFTKERVVFPRANALYVKLTNPCDQYKQQISMLQEYVRLTEDKIKYYNKQIQEEKDVRITPFNK